MDATICLDSFPERVASEACELDVEVLVPNEYGGNYVHFKRHRTYAEIQKQMRAHLNRIKCFKCGAEKPHPKKRDWYMNPPINCCSDPDWGELIDEYDSCGGMQENAEFCKPEERVVEIVCYCHVGGNEGYYANLGALVRNGHTLTRYECRYAHIYHIKSFRGMAHAQYLVKEMMLATGVWPDYCNR